MSGRAQDGRVLSGRASLQGVILRDSAKIILSGDEPGLFRELHRLGPAPRIQLVEDARRVRLDSVLADEQSSAISRLLNPPP